MDKLNQQPGHGSADLRVQREWEAALDAMRAIIFIHDSDYRVIRANKAYARAAGMDVRDVIGRPYWEVFPRRAGPLESCTRRKENDHDSRTEEITLDNGAVYLSRSFEVNSEQGEYLYSMHIMEDITEQKHLRDALEESAERYRSLFEHAPDAILLADIETGRLLDANPAAEQLIGRSHEEILSLHYTDLHPAYTNPQQQFDEYLQHALAGKTPAVEIPLLHADGREIPAELTACLIDLNGRKVTQGIFRDIAARIKTEQALRESEETFRAISNTAQDAVLLLDNDGNVAYWNPAAERIFGYSADEALGRNGHLLMVPSSYHEVIRDGWERFKTNGEGEVVGKVLELEAQRKSGATFPVEISVSAIQLKGTWHAVGIVRDISARRQAENKLREVTHQLSLSLHLLEDIVESVPIRIFWKDREHRFLGCNSLFAKDAGLDDPQVLIGKTDFDMGWTTQAQRYREDDNQVMASGIPKLNYEEPQTTPDGDTVWLRTSKVPLRNADHEVIGVVGIYDDITDEKLAQQRLARSESRLKEAQAVAQLGSWELDLVKNELWWSDENYRIFGIEPGNANTYESFLNTVHPEDREFVNKAYSDSVKNHTPYDIEHRLLLPDGSVKWINERCKTYYDDDGTPLRSAGTTLDITARHQAEQALNRSNRALRTLSSCNAVLIHAGDENHLLENMCRVITDTGGYRFAWIGFAERDENKTVRPVAHAGYEHGYLETIQLTYADHEHGRGPVGRTIRSGEPAVVRDVATDPCFTPWCKAAVERGYASVLALPLRDNGEVFGSLSIYAAEADAFDEDETRLLSELADDLAFGIQSLRARAERDQLQAANLEAMARHKEVFIDAIGAIALTVEKRDPYTAGHQQHVADLAVAIGRELGLDDDRLEGLHLGATIHDLGKIYVPAEILNRPGRLSAAEFEMIKSHSQVGFDIIKDVKFPWPVAEMVLQHHERLDGSGYPNGLKGDEIILEARILAVADVVEAITSHRPYRPARGLDTALGEIEANRGTLYDPQVADACLHLIRDTDYTFETG